MSKARNIADLLDASGDVSIDALDNVSSSNNSIDFTVASGGSVTAKKVVSTNASGEVGVYPTVNTYGTERGSAATGPYLAVSANGSRAITFADISDYSESRITISGYNITDSGDAVTGTTVEAAIVEFGNSYTTEVQAWGITDTKFVLELVRTRWVPGSSGANNKIHLVEVDASGNVAILASSEEVQYNGYGGSLSRASVSTFLGARSATTFVHVAELRGGDNTVSYYTWHIDSSANTVTSATDPEVNGIQLLNDESATFVNSGANVVVATGNNYYTATYATTNFGSFTTTAAGLIAYVSGGNWYFPFTGIALAHYVDTDGVPRIASYTVNSTTGALTYVDDALLDTTLTGGTNPFVSIRSQDGTDFIAVVDKYVLTFQLDGSGNIIKLANGFLDVGATLNIPNYLSNATVDYNAADIVWLTFVNVSASDVAMIPLTINAYTTDQFYIAGIAEASASSGTVKVITSGVVTGLTGLSTNSTYYVDTSIFDGSITTSTGGAQVGRAISPTSLILTYE